MTHLTRKVLGFEAGQAFSDFNRIVIQDGTSFALHAALAHVFPGRFQAVSPAAVELHCTLELLQEAPITLALSPDTDSEHDSRPEPESLRGELFLADRGYLDLTYWRDLDRHGGCFMVRGKSHLNPRVLSAYREDGQRLKSCQDRELQAIISKFPKQQRAELEVEWLIEGKPFRLRLMVRWNPQKKCFDYLLMNLPQDRYTISMICLGYKFRWQVELVNGELKSGLGLGQHQVSGDQKRSENSMGIAVLAYLFVRRAGHHEITPGQSWSIFQLPHAFQLRAITNQVEHNGKVKMGKGRKAA